MLTPRFSVLISCSLALLLPCSLSVCDNAIQISGYRVVPRMMIMMVVMMMAVTDRRTGLLWVQKHPVLAAVIWMCGKVCALHDEECHMRERTIRMTCRARQRDSDWENRYKGDVVGRGGIISISRPACRSFLFHFIPWCWCWLCHSRRQRQNPGSNRSIKRERCSSGGGRKSCFSPLELYCCSPSFSTSGVYEFKDFKE